MESKMHFDLFFLTEFKRNSKVSLKCHLVTGSTLSFKLSKQSHQSSAFVGALIHFKS